MNTRAANKLNNQIFELSQLAPWKPKIQQLLPKGFTEYFSLLTYITARASGTSRSESVFIPDKKFPNIRIRKNIWQVIRAYPTCKEKLHPLRWGTCLGQVVSITRSHLPLCPLTQGKV